MSSNQEAETSATAGAATRLDRINELYYGTILPEETIRIGRERIHWMCSQCRGPEILDVGCSQGIVSILLAREGFSVTAIDSFPDAIAYARKEIAREAEQVRQRIDLIETDLSAFATNKKFDTVILGEVVEHQTRPRQLIEHAAALLAPGGRIVLTTPFGVHPHPDHKVYLYPRDLTEMFEGLASIQSLNVVDRYMQCIAVDAREKRARSSRPVSLTTLLDVTETGARAMEHHLHSRLDERAGRLRSANAALAQAKKQVADLQKSIDAESDRRKQVDAALGLAKQRVADLEQALLAETTQRSRADAALLEARKRLAELEKQAAAETERRLQADAALAEANDRAAALEESLSTERDLRSRADEAVIEARARASDLETSLAAEADEKSRAKAALAEAGTQMADLEKLAAAETERRLQADAALGEANGRATALEESLSAERDLRSQADAALVQARAQVSGLKKSLAAESSQRSRADAALLDARKQLADQKKLAAAEAERRQQADAALGEANGRATALEESLAAERDLRSQADAALVQARDHVSALEKSLAAEADERARADGALLDTRRELADLEKRAAAESERRLQADAALGEANGRATALEESLAAERDLRSQADAALAQAQGRLTDLEKSLAAETDQRSRADAALLDARDRLAELEKRAAAETERRLQADAALGEARDQATVLEESLSAEKDLRSRADAALAEAQDHVSALERSLAAEADERARAGTALLDARNRLAELEESFAAERELRSQADAALAQAQGRVTGLEQSLAAETDRRSTAETALLDASNRLAELEKQAAAEAERRLQADAALVEARNRAAALEETLAAERDMRSQADAALAQAQGRVTGLEQSLAAETEQRSTAETALLDARNRLAELEKLVATEVDLRSRADAAVVEARGHASDLERILAAKLDELSTAERTMLEAQGRISELEAQAARARDRQGDLEQSLATEKRERVDVEKAIATSRRTLQRTEQQLRDLQENLGAAENASKIAAQRAEALQAQLERQQVSSKERAVRHEAELAKARDALAKLHAELATARHDTVAMEQRVHAARRSVPYRLGHVLIEGGLPDLIGVPRQLLALRANARRMRTTQERGLSSLPDQNTIVDEVRRAFSERGAEAAIAIIMDCAEESQHTRLLAQYAKLLADTDPVLAFELGRRAHKMEPRPDLAKWLAFLAYDRGFIDEPAALLATLPADLKVKPSERNLIEQIKGAARARKHLPGFPPRNLPGFKPVARSVLYVTSMALPFHTTAYARRTQGLVEGIMNGGWSVTCVTRPGYPDDRADRPTEANDTHHEVGAVTYRRLQGASAARQGIDAYVRAAAKVLEALARDLRPAIIHAASNHMSGLPALIAARRLGIPFVYEVRGLWEHTPAARNTGWTTTERFALSTALETRVARNADLVVTLTPAMARELETRGISPDKILLAPNSVDPDAFATTERDSDLARQVGVDKSGFTIAYIGSLGRDEGVDDLVRALAILASRGVDANLMVAGNGEALESIARLATELGLGEKIKWVGHVPHDRTREYWSLADAAAFPRKPYPQGKIVSPLAPLEAMAMGIPTVVSDIAPLRKLASEGQAALVHAAGDPNALAECLERLARDPDLRRRLGQAARAAAQLEGTWHSTAQAIIDRYVMLSGGGETAEAPGSAEPASIAPPSPSATPESPAASPPVDLMEPPAAPLAIASVDQRSTEPAADLTALQSGTPEMPAALPARPAVSEQLSEPAPDAVVPGSATLELPAAAPRAEPAQQPGAPPARASVSEHPSEPAPDLVAGQSATPESPADALTADPAQHAAPAGSLPDIIELPPKKNSMTEEQKVIFTQRLAEAYDSGGPAAVRAYAERQAEGRSSVFRAYCLLNAGRCCQSRLDVRALRDFADAAAAADKGASTVRGVARAYYSAGDVLAAAAMIDLLEKRVGTFNERDAKLATEVRGQDAMIRAAMKPPMPSVVESIDRRISYILHNSLPYSSAGYATRSHGISRGVLAAGYEIRPYTRPGFPFDVRPDLEGQTLPPQSDLDGVVYRRLFENGRKGQSEYNYIMTSADVLEDMLRQERPALVHAASNYVTAMPALIAARRLGLPFIYEVRGFWEITRSSREYDFMLRPRYQLMRQYEALVARQADAVITLTGAMKDELIERGVDGTTISIAHNAVDPDRFHPISRDDALAERLGIRPGVPVIGYVGSFVHYEGLDDLVVACGELAAQGVEFRLLLVGDGAILEQVQELVQTHNISDRTILTGRVPHEQVESYYSLITVAPFPRKPWEVCEKVSPLKPFEALAMEKVVVVSSVRALTEIIEDGKNGLVFEKGNTSSLADVLRRCITDPALCQRLGPFGRQWILEHRTWQRSGGHVAEVYDAVLARRPQREDRRHDVSAAEELTSAAHP